MNSMSDTENNSLLPSKEVKIEEPQYENTLLDVARTGKKISTRKPFYSLFLLSLNKVIDNKMPMKSMGVGKNGLNLQLRIYEPFWHGLTPLQKMALLLHELMHICLFHITQWKEYSNPHVHNIATDIYINYILISEFGIECLPHADMKSEEFKKYILPKMENIMERYNSGEITKEECNKLFEHEIPPRACLREDYDISESEVEKGSRHIYNILMERLNNDNKGNSPENRLMLVNLNMQSQGVPCPNGHKDWKDISENASESELKAIEQQLGYQLKQVSEEVSRQQGTIPNELKGIIDSILNPAPPIYDWKAHVRKFVSGFSRRTYTKSTRLKPNKRFPDFPTTKIKHRQSIALITDTSGSVSSSEYIEFIEQSLAIKKATGCDITMIECDAHVDEHKGVYELKNIGQIQKRLEEGLVTGGGGTSLDPALYYLNRFRGKYTCAIYFTDGYVSPPDYRLVTLPLMIVLSSAGSDLDSFTNDDGGWGKYNTIKIPQSTE